MADVAATAIRARRPRLLSSFETWPDWFFYAPVPLWWFYLAVRYRGLTLPAIANTTHALSGFLGESKSAALQHLGPVGQAHLAAFATIVTSTNGDDENRAMVAMDVRDLRFPIVVKPDVGQNGAGVKIVRDSPSLARWLAGFPADTKVILQKYVEHEGEAGVFYIRRPDEPNGHIASLTLKYLPFVRGDGVSTLRELILEDRRAQKLARIYFPRHRNRLDKVLPDGKRLRLVSVGNHCRGAIFKNGAEHITPAMRDVFDAIAREIPGFHFGRFDVKFQSLGDFERGRNFSILEINGADAEMTHIWDAEETLLDAYASLFRQYRIAFEIGASNRARGARPVPPASFIAAWYRNRKRLKKYRLEE